MNIRQQREQMQGNDAQTIVHLLHIAVEGANLNANNG